jgi:hypothetical protein
MKTLPINERCKLFKQVITTQYKSTPISEEIINDALMKSKIETEEFPNLIDYLSVKIIGYVVITEMLRITLMISILILVYAFQSETTLQECFLKIVIYLLLHDPLGFHEITIITNRIACIRILLMRRIKVKNENLINSRKV